MSGDIFRRDLNSFNFFNNQRNTTYEQATTGLQVRVGVPINEFIYAQVRYGLSQDDISLDRATFFSDPDGAGPLPVACDPILAGRFLCDAVGNRLTSSLGYTLLYDDRDNRIRPTRGQSIGLSQDFAGLGGSVKYIKTRLNADKFWRIGSTNFIFSLAAEGGYIHPLENRGSAALGIDDVRLTDRFYLGEPQIRGFDIRGVGPRVQRIFYQGEVVSGVAVNTPQLGKNQIQDDAIGGRAYYLGRAELQIPLGSGAKELGLRPSVFVDVGAVFNITTPLLQTVQQRFINADGTQGAPLYYFVDTAGALQTSVDALNANGTARTPALQFEERFFGDSMKPRVSVGFGVNWNSPFGPFRIDIAKALLKERGDDTKLFTFNVGTQF